MALLIIIFLCIPLFLIICGIIAHLEPDNPDDAAEISFEAFQQFYLINPNRWKLYDDYVECIIPDKNKYRIFDYTEKFYFSFFAYQKYKKFLKKVKQDKINTRNMQATAKMLNAVKQDIANMESLAQQQKKQAVDNLNDILKNL